VNLEEKNNPFKKYLSPFSGLMFFLFQSAVLAETKPYLITHNPQPISIGVMA